MQFIELITNHSYVYGALPFLALNETNYQRKVACVVLSFCKNHFAKGRYKVPCVPFTAIFPSYSCPSDGCCCLPNSKREHGESIAAKNANLKLVLPTNVLPCPLRAALPALSQSAVLNIHHPIQVTCARSDR